jgi:hypothetical protein
VSPRARPPPRCTSLSAYIARAPTAQSPPATPQQPCVLTLHPPTHKHPPTHLAQDYGFQLAAHGEAEVRERAEGNNFHDAVTHLHAVPAVGLGEQVSVGSLIDRSPPTRTTTSKHHHTAPRQDDTPPKHETQQEHLAVWRQLSVVPPMGAAGSRQDKQRTALAPHAHPHPTHTHTHTYTNNTYTRTHARAHTQTTEV